MGRVISFCLFLTPLSLLLVGWQQPALAYWPPLQEVEAWVQARDPGYGVYYTVYDPQRQVWKTDYSGPWDNQPVIVVKNGVVAWVGQTGGAQFILTRVYDPGRGLWRGKTSDLPYDSVPLLTNENGVVAWYANTRFHGQQIGFSTYDPLAGAWIESRYYAVRTFDLKNKDGVVASIYQPDLSYHALYSIYDPQKRAWISEDFDVGSKTYSISIENATVLFEAQGIPKKRGYDPIVCLWYEGVTKPRACIRVQPTYGKAPLWVWFTDMSIGAEAWNLSFGDGGKSYNRSVYHSYVKPGSYLASQTVTGQEGKSNTPEQKISVFSRSLPFLLLLLLD